MLSKVKEISQTVVNHTNEPKLCSAFAIYPLGEIILSLRNGNIVAKQTGIAPFVAPETQVKCTFTTFRAC